MPAIGGLAILVASCLAGSALTISLGSLALVVAISDLAKRYD